jgi:predicted alpha/beta-fold hydrolase
MRDRFRSIASSVLPLLTAAACLSTQSGCFIEQSFPMRPGDYVRVRQDATTSPMTTRRWLVRTHAALKHLLPNHKAGTLLTDDLTDESGHPVDVMKHFDRDLRQIQSVFFNFWGLESSAQAAGALFEDKHPPRCWPGFEEVRIPISDRLATIGWLGLAKNGDKIRKADCIVVLTGMFGHNGVQRTEDICKALVAVGYHVLAYENRGYGLTDLHYPDVAYAWGILTTRDLMMVSDWLEDKPYIRHAGLIGYCWSANQVLLAAWYENCPPGHTSITPKMAEYLPPLPKRRRFRAGVIAVSPTLRFEELIDRLEVPLELLVEPALRSLQYVVEHRMKRKHYPEVSGSLRKLIEYETARSELDYPNAVPDGLRFLRFLPYKGNPAGDKLANTRIPVLIIHASDDPMGTAQEVADFMAGLDNPNVAAQILYGGGHLGNAYYSRPYYFSMILNFFDPEYGAAAMSSPTATATIAPMRSADGHAH